ncbi:hypothetical protein [Geofilum rhodophaeum]|uniref:hypothetical protein n=1 Tax=Geofilum rhodophaeum TaxID=1965019 RepID=UPI000B5229C4|nr:hypothetical protein [Geofilum rhodophaeum]
MKNIFLFSILALLATSCGHKKNQSGNSEPTRPSFETSAAISINEMLSIAPNNVGKEVVLKGVITHVCKHSGKRCFIKDSTNTSIRVEAKGEIGGFNSELNGHSIYVKGNIRENRLSQVQILDWERKTLAQKEQAEIDQNQCSAELANIQEMKDWMATNNKDFYSIYYLDGTDYQIAE